MTKEEHEKLVERFGEKAVTRMIEVLNDYKGSSGRKYKSDYHALKGWVADKVTKEIPNANVKADSNGRPNVFLQYLESRTEPEPN